MDDWQKGDVGDYASADGDRENPHIKVRRSLRVFLVWGSYPFSFILNHELFGGSSLKAMDKFLLRIRFLNT